LTKKHSKPKLVAHTQNVLTAAMNKAAQEAFEKHTVDNSPQLDNLLFREILEKTAALNLGNLSHDLVSLANELPPLIEGAQGTPVIFDREGYLMAVAFEAGRRYNLLQVFALLSDEVETLPDEASDTVEQPILEM
jgi:hypothetical protein